MSKWRREEDDGRIFTPEEEAQLTSLERGGEISASRKEVGSQKKKRREEDLTGSRGGRKRFNPQKEGGTAFRLM